MKQRYVFSVLISALPGIASGCAQLIGIEDLPTFEDAGAQSPDAGARPPDAGVQPPDAGTLPLVDGSVPPGPDAGAGAQRRKQITIDAARVEAPASGSLTNFPVLFSTIDSDLAARAAADGRDIYFTAADGTSRLDYEIEKWDPATGELVAWVQIPQLSSAVDTVFHIHYGDPALAQPANPVEVWANGFVAVWHLADDPGPGTSGGIVDSTTGNDGTAHTSMTSSDLVPGQIGNAIDFDGDDDEISFQNPISGATPHTISVWVNQRDTSSPDALVVLGNDAVNQARMFYATYIGGTIWYAFYANDNDTGIDIQNDGWTLLHWTFDGTENRVYIDGVLVEGPTMLMDGVNTQGSDGRIGNVPPGSPGFGSNMELDGQVDEVRIATVARTAEWIQTELNNQSAPSSFYTVGPEIIE